MKRLFVLALFFIANLGGVRGAEKFSLDVAHSTIGFEVGFAGMTKVEGRFTDADATIFYDETNLANSSVTALLAVSGIDTGLGERDKDLQSARFFDAEHFPIIMFQSDQIEKTESGYRMSGRLTIHGVTKQITFPFIWNHKKMADPWGNSRIDFEAKLIVNRKDYGVVGPDFWNKIISDDADILLRISSEIPNFDKWNFPAPDGKKPVAQLVLDTINKDGVEAAIRAYREEKQKQPPEYDFGPAQLNTLGYRLLQHGRVKEAAAVFQLNTEAFPNKAFAYDSLGDAYLAAGEDRLAMENFKKALAINPKSSSAIESVRVLTKGKAAS